MEYKKEKRKAMGEYILNETEGYEMLSALLEDILVADGKRLLCWN